METQHSKIATSHDFGGIVTWQNASMYDCLDSVDIYLSIQLKAPTNRPVVLGVSVRDINGAVLHSRKKTIEAGTITLDPIILDNLTGVDVLGGRSTPPGEYFINIQVSINGNQYSHNHKVLVRNMP